MYKGKDHVAGSDSIQTGRQGGEEAEDETQEEDPPIEGLQIKTGEPGEKQNKESDFRFRQETFFDAHDHDKKKEEKYLNPGVQLLEEPFLASRIPLDTGRSNQGRKVSKALIEKGCPG